MDPVIRRGDKGGNNCKRKSDKGGRIIVKGENNCEGENNREGENNCEGDDNVNRLHCVVLAIIP